MKIDRMMGILTVLLSGGRVTAPQLARRFEVSRRTITRDIEALCMAGIPVITGQGAGGGIWISEGYKLDKSVLTSGELSSLIAGLKGLASVSEPARIESTLTKLGVGTDAVVSLREPIVIELAHHHKASLSEKIELLKGAILRGRVVAFDYYSEKGKSRRRIEPYTVVFQGEAWYVLGYCLDKQDWRVFKLARLWALELDDQAFAPREIPPERARIGGHLHDRHPLVALFDPSVRHRLIEDYGLDCCKEQPDGRLRLEIGYTNEDYILSWLLAFGDQREVLQPDALIRRLRDIAQKMLAVYG